ADELRRASKREAVPGSRTFLCALHLEEWEEAGRVEPVPDIQPTQPAGETAASNNGGNDEDPIPPQGSYGSQAGAQARGAAHTPLESEDAIQAQVGNPDAQRDQATARKRGRE